MSQASLVPVVTLALILSVGLSCAREACPEVVPPGGTAAETASPVQMQAAFAGGFPALFASEPADDAAPEVREQFGRLVGRWSCQGESVQPDGAFKETPGRSRWTFFYTLGGQAIGDIYEPPTGAVGINLRVYDPDKGTWTLAWTTPTLRRYEHFEARQEGETLVMRGDIAAKGAVPDHRAKIVFFEMAKGTFEWRYEGAKAGSDGPWQVISKMHCEAAEVTVSAG